MIGIRIGIEGFLLPTLPAIVGGDILHPAFDDFRQGIIQTEGFIEAEGVGDPVEDFDPTEGGEDGPGFGGREDFPFTEFDLMAAGGFIGLFLLFSVILDGVDELTTFIPFAIGSVFAADVCSLLGFHGPEG